MLVRDPINKSIAKQTQEINGVLITPVDTIKYLGTYLTSELSRRDTIKARCKQAIRAKGLIPFIKKTKMHWKIAKLIYKMRKVGRPIYTWEDSLRQDLNYHNRNQEEWDTLAQNKMEMKKAADELYQLPETDTESSAPSEENEE
ncbi:hypothetical protein EVAR_4674_1 [Eumeta japonica]|uniref:Uncharacterized protein n=1 Tax=Eumeta variegata TaxID=151549 RepID=A0A4C1YCN1_EUMVA|nr:hypothetical protein EVAR_4674_1 [Eumeta japonica]